MFLPRSNFSCLLSYLLIQLFDYIFLSFLHLFYTDLEVWIPARSDGLWMRGETMSWNLLQFLVYIWSFAFSLDCLLELPLSPRSKTNGLPGYTIHWFSFHLLSFLLTIQLLDAPNLPFRELEIIWLMVQSAQESNHGFRLQPPSDALLAH